MSGAPNSQQPPPIPSKKDKGFSPRLCVLMNLTAFPGLGTIMAGRKVGYAQATVMVAGFVLTMGFLLLYMSCIYRFALSGNWSDADLKSCYQPHRWMLYAGLPLSILAWLWAAFSSWQILREQKR